MSPITGGGPIHGHVQEKASPQEAPQAQGPEEVAQVLTEPQGPSAVDLAGMRLEVRRVADLRPSEYNPRTITPEALAGLRRSLQEFGLVEPIVWNRRTQRVVGGHQRLKAMQAAGTELCVVTVVDLDEAREKALNLTLNNDALMGTFNERTTELLMAARDSMPETLFAALRFEDIFYPGKVLEFVPGAARDYGVEQGAGDFEPPMDSNVRSVRLIMDDNQLAEFKGLMRSLGNLWGIENPTEVVMQALRNAVEE